MANLNRVTVMGVLGVTLKQSNFPTVAVLHAANTTGERKQATEWHRITTNNHLAEIASKYLKKGGKGYIEGSLRTRKWKDQSRSETEITEIRADELQLL